MQSILEGAISAVTQEDVRLVGSGRTDSGAHALRQVVAFSTESAIPASTLLRAVNAHLPKDVVVTTLADVDPSFHPRYDATSRLYRYLIWNRSVRSPFWEKRAAHVPRRLDERAMRSALRTLVGRHDLSTFIRAAEQGSRERTLYHADAGRSGDLVWIELEGAGFMRHMVRSIVGTVVDVGLGKIDLARFCTIVRSRDRRQGRRTAPAYGLYLAEVRYTKEDGFVAVDPGCRVEAPCREEETR